MERSFKEALKNRRSYYAISNKSLITDSEIEEIINTAVLYLPSPYNSQTSRIVLLLGDNHKKLWNIVKDTLRKITPAEAFLKTEAKIDGSFASGYGTVLYFEDQKAVKKNQDAFPLYSETFATWSQHTTAMHQIAIWTMLEDAGFGASLQHYNPLIDEQVAKAWDLPENWKLTAQMPFGVPTSTPGKKESLPLSERIRIFK